MSTTDDQVPVLATDDHYLARQFDWAAPGDQQEDAWLVRFCDKDCGEAIFTGPDAEREAWNHWNRYAPSFNIYVFRLARLKELDHAAPYRARITALEGELAAIKASMTYRHSLIGRTQQRVARLEDAIQYVLTEEMSAPAERRLRAVMRPEAKGEDTSPDSN